MIGRLGLIGAACIGAVTASIIASAGQPDGEHTEIATPATPERWYWDARIEDIGPFPCTEGFRRFMRAILNLEGSDHELSHTDLLDAVIALEHCVSMLGTEDRPQEGAVRRDWWIRSLRDGAFRTRDDGSRTFHPAIEWSQRDAVRAYTVTLETGGTRTLLQDARVVDLGPTPNGYRPALYTHDDRVIAMQRDDIASPFDIVVYADASAQTELWRARVGTHLVVAPETADPDDRHSAWFAHSGDRYFAFGVHTHGFYLHVYDSETGRHQGGYAYHATPVRGEAPAGVDTDPAGRAW